MAKFLKYREREALKQRAASASEDALRRLQPSLAEWTGITWLASPPLPIRAVREAVTGLALWFRSLEYDGREDALAYLRRRAWVIEPEGRFPSPDRKNALAAFVAPPAGTASTPSY